MKTEALHHKLPKRLAEFKVATLVTLLSDIKAEAIIDSLADRLTDVEINKLGKTVAQRCAKLLVKTLA